MKYLSILFLLPAIAVSQIFPGAVATNSNLYVASDQATSSLSAAIGASDLSIGVFSASKFRPFNVITIDSEQIKICSIASNILTVCSGGRGFAGTNAVSHNKGASVANFVSAIYHNTMATELESVETWLNPGTGVRIGNGTSPVTNLPQLDVPHGGTGSGGLTGVIQGNGTAPFTALPSIDVPHGGTGLNSVPIGGLLFGNGTSPLNPLGIGPPLNYIRRKPNVVTPTDEYIPPRQLEVPDFNFPNIVPGGALSAGVPATVTLPYDPLGVAGIDVNHYLWISGGAGTSEAVLITGGTCSGGAAGNCTLQFTPANSHSGLWTLTSASDGIQEAVNTAFISPVYMVHLPATKGAGTLGEYLLHAPVSVNIVTQRAQTIYGDGMGYYNNIAGTVISNLAATPGFSLVGDLVNNACEGQMTLRNFTLHGSPTSGTGIEASNACMLRIDHVFQVESQFHGLSCTPNCYTLEVTNSFFYSNGLDGALVSSAVNEVHFEFDGFQANCRQAAGITCNGLTITSAGNNALAISVTKSGFALDGIQPLGAYPAASFEASFFDVKSLTFSENYCEQAFTGCLSVGSGSRGITISGNYMQQGGINIGTNVTGINIFGNHLTSGSVVNTITNVANSGGFCQITLASPPTNGPFTAGSFVALTGIGGATACNDNAIDTAATVQSVVSSTVFVTGRPFGGSYTSGGSAMRAGGYSIGGVAGYADAHIFGNSLNFGDGDIQEVGGDLLPGTGANIASASVITIKNQAHLFTGSGTIDTMLLPSGFAGQFCALSAGGTWATSTAGNFAATFTATGNIRKCWTYDPTTSKWY